MKKIILITGSTDGIGLATARTLLSLGHMVLLHGRNSEKLAATHASLAAEFSDADIDAFTADLSSLSDVENLANSISKKYQGLDVIINNAGVYSVPNNVSADNLDTRFVVNTIAPYLLTKKLLPLLNDTSRVINLSSAAQAPFNPVDIAKKSLLSDGTVYAQSKLALAMWSRGLALKLGKSGPVIVAVNPASMLGSKMVKQAYGVAGGDLQIGADILTRAAQSEEFSQASGLYFDNDIRQFTAPHPDGTNPEKIAHLLQVLDDTLATFEH